MSKKRKLGKKRAKVQSKLSKVFSSSQNNAETRLLYFSNLTPSEIRSNFFKIANQRAFTESVQLTLNGLESIYVAKTPNATLDKNIAWCVGLVCFHAKTIQFALDRESEIQRNVFTGNYELALDTLDQIDQTCGISHWSITLKSSIQTLISEADEGNSLTKKSPSPDNYNSLLRTVVYYTTSFISDEATLISDFRVLKAEIEKSQLNNAIKDFFFYKFFSHCETDENFENVFNREKNSSILDVFFLLITFFAEKAAKEQEIKVGNNFHDFVKALNDSFQYSPIQRIANSFGIETTWEVSPELFNMVDQYSSGDYDKVAELVSDKALFSYDYSLSELITKAYLRSCNKSSDIQLSTIPRAIVSVLTKNDDFKTSLTRLLYYSYKFRSLIWFRQLQYFLQREYLSSSAGNEKDLFDNLILIHSKLSTPRISKVISPELQTAYLKALKKASPGSATIKLYEAVRDKDRELISQTVGIDSLRAKKYTAAILSSEGQYEEACKLLQTLKISGDDFTKIEATKELVRNLLLQGNLEEAIQNFVEIVLENNNVLYSFDAYGILSKTEKLLKTNANIDIPIALSLYSRFVDSNLESNLKYSFETFLTNNKVTNPTELFGQEEKFGEKKLYYFLDKVCIPQVMSLFSFFTSMRQIEECRLKICNYLLNKTEDNDGILSEIISINKLLLTKRAVKKVDHSRIFVDQSVFFGRDSEPFRALFERYKELSTKNDYSTYDDEKTLKTLLFSIKNSDLKDSGEPLTVYLSAVQPLIALNKKNSTFLSLAKLIKHEFTYGEKGLNSYLSTRIRHGVFPAAFRNPISDESLYFPPSAKFDEFAQNWLSAHPNLDENNKTELDQLWKLLVHFSSEYDKIITKINDEWLRIYSLEGLDKSDDRRQESKALFDYNTSSLDCFYLQEELPISPSYEDFINVTLKWLWDKTEFNLTQVKNKLKGEAQDQAIKLLDCLKEDVLRSKVSESTKHELCNSIERAKQGLKVTIESICSWFTHNDIDDEQEEFDIDIAVDIVARSLNLNVETENNIKCLFTERNLFHLVDLFHILLENAVSKSNVSRDVLYIQILINKTFDEKIVIEVKNNFNPTSSIEHLNSSLDFYRDAYGDEELIADIIQQEGGTGFFKIWKILQKDLEINHSFEVEIDEDLNFCVKLTLNPSTKLRLQ